MSVARLEAGDYRLAPEYWQKESCLLLQDIPLVLLSALKGIGRDDQVERILWLELWETGKGVRQAQAVVKPAVSFGKLVPKPV